jgi:hypothetical protein
VSLVLSSTPPSFVSCEVERRGKETLRDATSSCAVLISAGISIVFDFIFVVVVVGGTSASASSQLKRVIKDEGIDAEEAIYVVSA